MEPRRRNRATYKQLNLFVKFMSDNPNLARGVNYRTAFGKHYHDAKWTELANLLNAQENGMNKSPRGWNRYWKDLKSGIKKKVQAMKKLPEHTKTLSSIELIIYKNLCNKGNRKNAVIKEKDCSYLQVPEESDHEPDQYEVEYLEETSCDETQMTNITDMAPVDSFDVGLDDTTLDDVQSELAARNDQALDLLNRDNFLVENILNESISTAEYKTELAEEATVMNNDVKLKNCDTNIGVNTSTNSYSSTDVLMTDIRNHLRELVSVQKERARSELRLASAHERRAILEEKRVRIEERRLKMEERRVTLEERKMEALEKRCFAQERLASAAERKNEITEHRMANSEFVIT